MNGMFRAFTLIELLLVMAIMGLLGTISVSGYRSMRRGMEQRGVTQIVEQFVNNARQRAVIDRKPVAIYYWNETRQDEDSKAGTLLVVGRAVAVHTVGRVSEFENRVLIDEFGDLRSYVGTGDEGEQDDEAAKEEAESGTPMNLYPMKENSGATDISIVGVATKPMHREVLGGMMTDPDWGNAHQNEEIKAYGYHVQEGKSDWKAGEAYGMEFAELTLPNNYIFGSDFSQKIGNPVKGKSRLFIKPSKTESVTPPEVRAIRLNASGSLTAESFDTDNQ